MRTDNVEKFELRPVVSLMMVHQAVKLLALLARMRIATGVA